MKALHEMLNRLKSFFGETVESILVSLLVLLIIFNVIAIPETVRGASMEPTLLDGERILVEKVTKHFRSYSRGDIVILHPPGDSGIEYVKRVIGVPGDTVKIANCKVVITSADGNVSILDESYLADDICTSGGARLTHPNAIRLNEDQYVVLGDNRSVSVDSRIFGPLTADQIVGKLVFRFWPFESAKFF